MKNSPFLFILFLFPCFLYAQLEVESSMGIKINTATLRTTITTPFNASDDWGGLKR